MSRDLPIECSHGKVIDWGDFGPDSTDGSVGTEWCPRCNGVPEHTLDRLTAIATWALQGVDGRCPPDVALGAIRELTRS